MSCLIFHRPGEVSLLAERTRADDSVGAPEPRRGAALDPLDARSRSFLNHFSFRFNAKTGVRSRPMT